jgi:hypothetical protein
MIGRISQNAIIKPGSDTSRRDRWLPVELQPDLDRQLADVVFEFGETVIVPGEDEVFDPGEPRGVVIDLVVQVAQIITNGVEVMAHEAGEEVDVRLIVSPWFEQACVG